MMWLFLMNLFLATIYVALTGDPGVGNFIIGFVLAFLVLAMFGATLGAPGYGTRFLRLGRFALWFLWILTKANLEVAWTIITPQHVGMAPRIIRYPVTGMTPAEITTLANAISLTPGTLSADLDEQRQVLYIHCMFGRDRAAAVKELDELRDRLLREVFGR